MQKRQILLVLIILALSFNLDFGSFITATQATDESSALYTVELTSGQYLDSDSDGYLDDLFITADLNCDQAINGAAHMYMYLIVYYPSGNYVHFLWDIKIFKHRDFKFEYEIQDGAKETGWYNAELHISITGHGSSSDSSYLSFDPPKSPGGGDPRCFISVY